MHNGNQNAIREKRIGKPIEMFADSEQGASKETFGLSFAEEQVSKPPSLSTFRLKKMLLSKHTQAVNRCE